MKVLYVDETSGLKSHAYSLERPLMFDSTILLCKEFPVLIKLNPRNERICTMFRLKYPFNNPILTIFQIKVLCIRKSSSNSKSIYLVKEKDHFNNLFISLLLLHSATSIVSTICPSQVPKISNV